MSTPNLLWSMIKRGCGRTTGIGALLGAGYGVILFATTMLPQFNAGNGALPLVVVTAYMILIAALFGAVVAGAIGFLAGPIGGLLCGVMTRLFFMPLHEDHLYQLITRIAGGMYGVVALLVAVRLISTSGIAPQIQTWREALMLYIFPSLIGGLAGIYISRPVTDLYRQVVNPAGDLVPQASESAVKQV